MIRVKSAFIIRKNKINKSNIAPIYLRVTVGQKRIEISTKKKIALDRWCSTKQRVKGTNLEANVINSYLDQIEREVLEAETQLLKEGKEITTKSIKSKLIGEKKVEYDILEYFQSHNDKLHSLIGNGYAENTYKRYRTCLKHLKAFIKIKFNAEKYYLHDINLKFIQDFEYYLKTKNKPCSHNSALKYIDHFRKVVYTARDQELITKNPFLNHKSKLEHKDPEYLIHSELEAIRNKTLPIGRVDRVRDVFLFCCYTGLAYADVEKLKKTDVQIDENGEKWIVIPRKKTEEPSLILILPVPGSIIDKYENDPETEDGNLLPVISNQKTNAYLKEIAELSGITKNLTFHMARHTFGTTVSLENGVPMDTVQKVMGHRDIRSTMLYARVTKRKVGRDLKILRDVIS